MNIPTLEFSLDSSLEDLAEEVEVEAKINASGEKLDLIFSLIEPKFDKNVIVELDHDSSTIKFISESDQHSMDVKMNGFNQFLYYFLANNDAEHRRLFDSDFYNYFI